MDNFISLLYKVNTKLDSSNFGELKFLCKDLLPYQSLNGKQDTDLFIMLKQRGYIDENNTSLIEELLFYLKRFDLLEYHFKLTKSTMVERLKNPVLAQISPYRCLLYELGNLVPNSKLAETKLNFTNILPRFTLENVTSLWDLFIELEKRDIIKEDNVNYLKQMAQYFEDENFKEHILIYEKTMAAAGPGSINTDESERNPMCRTEEPKFEYICSNPVKASYLFTYYQEDLLSHSTDPKTDASLSIIFSHAFYKMDSNPRGICLIISNFDFSKARCNPGQQDLGDRRGTKKDEESLSKVFSNLGFQVHISSNLGGTEIVQTINSYRERNHEENNCFICCLLSHGDKGVIYGTDGKSVPIKDLTFCFCNSQCPTLNGKPKLFFIQACQGKEQQRLVSLQTDACRDSAGSNISDYLIPDEPDFLLGMATTLHCVSYRDPYHGSWYIQSLCKQLHESYESGEDIISTLTKVNHELSQKQAYRYNGTQMPQPWTTLSRKLVFS